jgi:hypothetical protein
MQNAARGNGDDATLSLDSANKSKMMMRMNRSTLYWLKRKQKAKTNIHRAALATAETAARRSRAADAPNDDARPTMAVSHRCQPTANWFLLLLKKNVIAIICYQYQR